MLCYTSGTTGNPKGVALPAPFDHAARDGGSGAERSLIFHATAAHCCRLSPCSTPPAGALPFAGAMAAGVKFVFSTTNEAPVLHTLMLEEGITHSVQVCLRSGSPCSRIWMQRQRRGAKRGSASCGSSPLAGPRPRVMMIERLMKAGVRVSSRLGND